MRDVIVVGCGIVGATITKSLLAAGMDVLTIDDNRPLSGTIPSGGHLKPSWFGSMPKKEYEPALKLLDDVWGLKEEAFVVRPTSLQTTVYRVDTDEVIKTPRTIATVSDIVTTGQYPEVTFGDEVEHCRHLVVCAGVWCGVLLPNINVVAKQGVSFRIKTKLDKPFVKPWAPYKQVVAHQQKPFEVWVGDGSALLEANWTPERTEECLYRCNRALGTTGAPMRTLVGLRPYCKTGNDPCLFRRVTPKTWLVTGAGKSGTIAAGWAATKILKELT
jgi:glycine/D-amino acid oxidase-like deaminating enzyme